MIEPGLDATFNKVADLARISNVKEQIAKTERLLQRPVFGNVRGDAQRHEMLRVRLKELNDQLVVLTLMKE